MAADAHRPAADPRGAFEEPLRYALSLLRECELLQRENLELRRALGERSRDAAESGETARRALPDSAPQEQALREALRENQRLTQERRTLQQQTAHLLNLYVTVDRLHSSLERKEVLQILHEILANLVGSESVGIFELQEDQRTLRLLSSSGIDHNRHDDPPLEHGTLGHAVRTGEVYLGGQARTRDGGDHPVVASIPMTVGGRVCGVIALFDLLGHKSELSSSDLELFNLLRTHAGMALYASGLHRDATAPQQAP